MGSQLWAKLTPAFDAAGEVVGYSVSKIKSGAEVAAELARAGGNDLKNGARSVQRKIEGGLEYVGDHSVGDAIQGTKDLANNVVNYMGNTPTRQIVKDGRDIVTNSMEYKVASQQLQKAGNYGKTLLGDVDNFYHNADGTYNRYKVGGTVGAGLGIAGIIGYNTNN